MIFIEDILNNILYYVYFKQYNNIDIVKLVSKVYYKSMLFIFNKYNIKESILIATCIKNYRPEIDQKEYINEDFIIFDDTCYINDWINKKQNIKNYHSYLPLLTKEIIYINNNKLISTDHYIEYNYLDSTNLKSLNICINKLKFTEYIIYYFYIDLIYCYIIDFIILPYFDERILKKDKFLYYKKIKKNKFYNHNINRINDIEF